jgi:hypothetical protein
MTGFNPTDIIHPIYNFTFAAMGIYMQIKNWEEKDRERKKLK